MSKLICEILKTNIQIYISLEPNIKIVAKILRRQLNNTSLTDENRVPFSRKNTLIEILP